MGKPPQPTNGKNAASARGKRPLYLVFLVSLSVAFVSFIGLTPSVHDLYGEYELLRSKFSDLPNSGEQNLQRMGLQQLPSIETGNHQRTNDWEQLPEDRMRELPAPEYHVVISTGCSTFQDWQAYVLFYSAWKTKQRGYVTRVASGCTAEQAKKMTELHEREIAPIAAGRFFLHHTPSYRFVKPGVDYVYFNKAYGYRHWMVNALRYPYTAEKFDNTTFILLDPDQMILRPFTDDFSNTAERWLEPRLGELKVVRGKPFAQEYAMGYNYLYKVDMKKIVPRDEVPSPLSRLKGKDGARYQVGPPYIMKGYDLWRIVNKWVDVAPYVYDQLPEHISEMYAYSIAAAHLNLPHEVAHTFMVSHSGILKGEGWPLVNDKDSLDVCGNLPVDQVPHVLHYCQKYSLGKYFFSKYRFPGDFISCEAPMLQEPPLNIATLYNFGYSAGSGKREFEYRDDQAVRREAFMICYMLQKLNEAAEHYKRTNCDPKTANFNKTVVFFEDMIIP